MEHSGEAVEPARSAIYRLAGSTYHRGHLVLSVRNALGVQVSSCGYRNLIKHQGVG
jgi:hypothetical protein